MGREIGLCKIILMTLTVIRSVILKALNLLNGPIGKSKCLHQNTLFLHPQQ